MSVKRIVSFLPSATELLYEFGVQDMLYGVTHECKHPPDATSKLKVIRSAIKSNELTSKEIDAITCQLLKDDKDIFILDEKNLKDANPDLIISQETCEVCAAYTNHVNNAIEILEKRPTVVSMNPHNLHEIIDSVRKVGKILEKESKAKEITDSLENRIQNIQKRSTNKKPKVLAIEWIDPFFTAGHWIPEMIEIAGGINMISKVGEHSRRLNFQEIKQAEPDIIIMMPCGFDTSRVILEYNITLKENHDWNSLKAVKNKQVFAVDANSFFSKPSIRTIDGLEILAKIIQPKIFQDLKIEENTYSHI
ncbi:ABC transporter, substrate-binding protein [Candidatus Nitrosopumilus salaria BD31]|uniref:ABC transporter, substrate-binding protein n=1 Tax=Candidatus Nitrosopumilus salarius BD31 TaxID=859350 RepID=I3D2S9_9ARCH|nr:cobalamin-binding protein [Candidatus Nitrosopumilus salaria]EIJ66022.1 ABC transporter, substrate-binding protein [Candidatus Nitrosopumilus salaria BD31]